MDALDRITPMNKTSKVSMKLVRVAYLDVHTDLRYHKLVLNATVLHFLTMAAGVIGSIVAIAVSFGMLQDYLLSYPVILAITIGLAATHANAQTQAREYLHYLIQDVDNSDPSNQILGNDETHPFAGIIQKQICHCGCKKVKATNFLEGRIEKQTTNETPTSD